MDRPMQIEVYKKYLYGSLEPANSGFAYRAQDLHTIWLSIK